MPGGAREVPRGGPPHRLGRPLDRRSESGRLELVGVNGGESPRTSA